MIGDDRVPFRAIVETTPDGMLVTDGAGTLVLVNAEAERMFGYEPGELLGKSIDELVPTSVRPRHAKLMASYTAKPKVRLIGQVARTLYGKRKDGSEFAVEISLSPYQSDRGMLVIGGVRDISERKQLEAEIKTATDHLVSAIEAVPDAFVMTDDQDRVLRANAAARALLGHGDEFVMMIRAAGTLGVIEHAAAERWIAYHRAPTGTLELKTAGGRTLRITDRRTDDGGTVSLIADVTDLMLAREQAEAASAAKSEFLSSMSHELRTPLNAILGFAQLLENDRKRPLDDRQQERVGHVVRGGEHLLRLIDDVLDLSKIEDGRLAVTSVPVDAGEIVDEVARTLEPMAQRLQITIAVAPYQKPLPLVVADRTRLVQILMNFGSNAIKYGRERGHVTLKIEPLEQALRISVIDDGIGIAPEQRAKIFEPFQRAGQETGPIEGTGIGLTISRRLAALMHATIDFASTVNKGSVFWIDLRVQHGRAATPIPVRSLSGSTLATGPAIHGVLLVEDNPASTAFMRDLFEEFAAIDLMVASTAEDALEIARTRRPSLVIMDINLPGMNGFDATEHLHREHPALPVIGLSAAALPSDTNRAAALGFARYLTKPVRLPELTRVLEELLVSFDDV
ncbi:MAG: PAS domain S-box protein [Kofleriaceae bacterium]